MLYGYDDCDIKHIQKGGKSGQAIHLIVYFI